MSQATDDHSKKESSGRPAAGKRPVRVLIVDDSSVARQTLSQALEARRGVAVVGTAPDAYVARDRIVLRKPDVLVLDVNMPRLDGLTFLKHLMKQQPMPVVVYSGAGADGGKLALEAFKLGAAAVVRKPSADAKSASVNLELSFDQLHARILEAGADAGKIKAVDTDGSAEARGVPYRKIPLPGGPDEDRIKADEAKSGPIRLTPPEPHPGRGRTLPTGMIAIGGSTGATQAVELVLRALPGDLPPVLVVLHMPDQFTAQYATRVNQLCPMYFAEARDGQVPSPGMGLIARGNHHLRLVRGSGRQPVVRLDQGEPINRHRPSVDALFESVASVAGPDALGVILTGMGRDGAKGLQRMRQAGAYTIGQDEASSVVYGMPCEAKKLGAVAEEVDLSEIPKRILKWVEARRKAQGA